MIAGGPATLGSLAGLAFVSGLRLYSTVLALGLGIRLGLLDVPPALDQLRLLARTPILVIAGVAYLVEFFADKIPWVDTFWDAVHTFIRPLGDSSGGFGVSRLLADFRVSDWPVVTPRNGVEWRVL